MMYHFNQRRFDMKRQKKVFENICFDGNQFANNDFTRQKFTIDIDADTVKKYFEDSYNEGKYYLNSIILYYVLTDVVCYAISWEKTDDRVRLFIEDDKEIEFTVSGWKSVLREYCVYLDEDMKHIYGRRDILEKLQYLLVNNLIGDLI